MLEKNKIIIGISGKKQSGKSTLAVYLQAQHCLCSISKQFLVTQNDDGVVEYTNDYVTMRWDGDDDNDLVGICSFADVLKECCIDILGLTYEQCYGSNEDKNSKTKYFWDNLPQNVRSRYGDTFSNVPGLAKPTTPLPRSGRMTAREVLQVFGTDIMRNMFSDTVWVEAAFRRIGKTNAPVVLIPDVRFKSEVKAIMGLPRGYVIRLTRSIFKDAHPSETELDDFNFAQYDNKAIVVKNQDISIQEKNELVLPFLRRIVAA